MGVLRTDLQENGAQSEASRPVYVCMLACMSVVCTGVGCISHQSARIHITRVWTLFQGITLQRQEYTSSDANPHVDAVFSLLVAAEFSGYAADAGVSSTFHCIPDHILAPNRHSRPMNRCPGSRKALEIHIPNFDPLAATVVHVSSTDSLEQHQ